MHSPIKIFILVLISNSQLINGDVLFEEKFKIFNKTKWIDDCLGEFNYFIHNWTILLCFDRFQLEQLCEKSQSK